MKSDSLPNAAEQMRARLAVFEDLFEAFDDGIAVIDRDGTFLMGNARYREMFFDKGAKPRPGESAIEVVRRIVSGNRVAGLDQLDPEHAALLCLIDCYSFVKGAEFAMKDGRVIQVSSSPTKTGAYLMTFRDTGPDRIGERRAAELLSDGFASAGMGMVLWDAALSVQLVNAAWTKLAGPLQIGDDIKDFFRTFAEAGVLPVPEGQSIDTFMRDTISTMHSKPMKFLLDTKDGRRTQVSTFGIISGGVMATAVDLTVQRDAEDRARALLLDAVEALDIGILHLDADLKLLMFNSAADEILFRGGFCPQLGIEFEDLAYGLIDAGEIILEEGFTRRELAEGLAMQVRTFQTNVRPPWKDGRVLEFSTRPTAMGGVLISAQDLTEGVKAERAAKEANALVRTIVDASPTTFLVSKVETAEIVFATDASRQRFGDITSTLDFFLKPEDRDTYLEALLPTGSLTDYPVMFRRRDGSVMDGLTSARVIEYQGEQMIVSSTRDITDYLAMQAELEEQRLHALQHEKLSALGELLAGVAHELSNPLSIIVGYAMMLRDEVQDGADADKLDRIAQAADRCVRIVKLFLALARERPTTTGSTDINQLIEVAVSISDFGLSASGASLELDLPDEPIRIQADADQLTQVVSNILLNAGHAVADQGTNGAVRISAYVSDDQEAVIEIQDNGPGIPKEIRHRILEPFFTTKDVGNGTGIGLAFSHRVMTAHNGTLTFEEPSEGGARFRISLPVKSDQGRDTDQATVAIPNRGKPIRVLILENDKSICELYGSVLKRAGHITETSHNGRDSLLRCESETYDVVVSDMRLPDMDGQTFFRAMSKTNPKMAKRVIFLTGDMMNTEVAGFLKKAKLPYLEKPITPNDLVEQIAKLIGGKQDE